MKIYDTIKHCLELNPTARERRFRDQYLIALILKKHGYESYSVVPVNELLELAKDYVSYERVWRDVLQKEPPLRGRDHSDGKILSQSFQIKELGREVHFSENVKQLELIT